MLLNVDRARRRKFMRKSSRIPSEVILPACLYRLYTGVASTTVTTVTAILKTRATMSQTRDSWAGRIKRRTRLLNTDRKSTRLNSSHQIISYAVFCLKKKKTNKKLAKNVT